MQPNKYADIDCLIGVDHGTNAFGICVMDTQGTIESAIHVRNTKNWSLGKRLYELRYAVRDVLYLHRLRKRLLVLERPIHYAGHEHGAGAVGQGFGVCVLTAHDYDVPYLDIAPMSAKAALCHGSARKSAMIEAVRMRYPAVAITDTQEDLADAIALGLAALPIIQGLQPDLADRKKAAREQKKKARAALWGGVL
jgi:Holliday junction resolvasome RuvABC endonuclease subunit